MSGDPDGRAPARPDERSPSTMAIGLVLVLVGAALLAGQLLGLSIEDIGWPFFVIAVGAVLLLAGLIVMDEQGVVIAGTITTTVGLVLLFQDQTGRWESWAYAWALVGPTASGLGLALWGVRSGNMTDVRNGTWGMLGGLALFAVGFLFFEGVVGIGGERLALPGWLLPAVIMAFGGVLLLRGLIQRRPS
ncbi:MAG: hypothetical protein K5924_01690 [Chloroflexi bacterium]|nr:hypothetical protein [Chloroflexota bacterium]